MALMVLAAAAMTLAGDFDGDGRTDRARLVAKGETLDLVVDRGAGDLVLVEKALPLSTMLDVTRAGRYRTACGKGAGRAPCGRIHTDLSRDTLSFGTPESSRAVAVWRGDRFEVVWLMD